MLLRHQLIKHDHAFFVTISCEEFIHAYPNNMKQQLQYAVHLHFAQAPNHMH